MSLRTALKREIDELKAEERLALAKQGEDPSYFSGLYLIARKASPDEGGDTSAYREAVSL